MLVPEASHQQLQKAAAYNHEQLFRQEAVALGGSLITTGGLRYTSGTPHSNSMVAFPDMSPAEAGEQLDGLIAFYLRHPPRGAGCWSLDPPRPADLGIRLLARGFQPGWRPRWMALDLLQLQTGHASPKGL